MKSNSTKFLAFIFLLSTAITYAQVKESLKKETVQKDQSLLIKSDSTAILEAKKKAAAEEKAKLPKPYNSKENAEEKIAELIVKATSENKNIILQAGGNWCIWCLRFNNFVQTTPELKEIVDQNYLYYHLNYSPDNKNEKVFAKYGNPGEKYGYPVFIILDRNGKLLHVQDSAVLEEGKGYGIEKVKNFLNSWKP